MLSDAQPYERGHPIYPKYVEELPYIPETSSKYVEIPLIYSKYVRNQPQTKYVGEPHNPRNAALAYPK